MISYFSLFLQTRAASADSAKNHIQLHKRVFYARVRFRFRIVGSLPEVGVLLPGKYPVHRSSPQDSGQLHSTRWRGLRKGMSYKIYSLRAFFCAKYLLILGFLRSPDLYPTHSNANSDCDEDKQ